MHDRSFHIILQTVMLSPKVLPERFCSPEVTVMYFSTMRLHFDSCLLISSPLRPQVALLCCAPAYQVAVQQTILIGLLFCNLICTD